MTPAQQRIQTVGHNFMPEYQISAIPYVLNDTVDSVTLTETYDGTDYRVIKLPKISNFIKLKTSSATLKVYFSRNDVIDDKNYILIKENENNESLKLRIVNLYFSDAESGSNIQLIAGLTTIDRKEFTDMVEIFLGDDTSLIGE